MTRPEPPDLDRSAHICGLCNEEPRRDLPDCETTCVECGKLLGEACWRRCSDCDAIVCAACAVPEVISDGVQRERCPRCEFIRQHKGEKCDCVSGTRMDGGGPELAAEDCDVCHGTGRIGQTEFEDRRDAA
jgi:hypothetical protein